MDDDQYADLFHRAVATLEPPTARLLDAGLRRGRHQQNWRRAGVAASGVVLVAGVAVIGVTALAGSPPRHGGDAGTGGTGAGATRTVTPQALLQTALDTLPRAGRTSAYSGTEADGYVSANFVFDDGSGAGAVQVAIGYPPLGSGPKSFASPAPCEVTSGSSCVALADGGHLQTRQGHQYADGRTPNAAEWDAELVRADGVSVSVLEWNAPAPKGAATTRSAPPFSVAEVTRWIENPAWQPRISAARARATAHLFTPLDVQAKVRELTTADCNKAVAAHKIPAANCRTAH